MLNKKTDIFKDIDFNLFTSQIGEAVKSSYEVFWEQELKITIQAINDFKQPREEALVSGVDFFSSQIKVENHKPVVIRLSKDFVDNSLSLSLMKNKPDFNFKDLTPLETKILNGYCEYLYKQLKDVLISPKEAKLSEKSNQNVNFLFLIEPKGGFCSKIMITIPQDRVKLTPLEKTPAFNDEDFFSSNTIVKIKAGSSKVTFSELQNLAKDDIVVLEESKLSKLTLISGKVEKKFDVKINPNIIMNLDEDEEADDEENIQSYEEVTMEKNLWDDIQIEINAEFEKVKMTIGELKQITQGQIVDLGSIFDNEISLFVEERKVATGELIIINDRYAVRLNEVLNSDTEKPIDIKAEAKKTIQEKQKEEKVKPQPKPQPKPKKEEIDEDEDEDEDENLQLENEDEEFDYSDFEK